MKTTCESLHFSLLALPSEEPNTIPLCVQRKQVTWLCNVYFPMIDFFSPLSKWKNDWEMNEKTNEKMNKKVFFI